jgi:hypothetical protein
MATSASGLLSLMAEAIPDASSSASSLVEGLSFQFPEMNGFRDASRAHPKVAEGFDLGPAAANAAVAVAGALGANASLQEVEAMAAATASDKYFILGVVLENLIEQGTTGSIEVLRGAFWDGRRRGTATKHRRSIDVPSDSALGNGQGKIAKLNDVTHLPRLVSYLYKHVIKVNSKQDNSVERRRKYQGLSETSNRTYRSYRLLPAGTTK